MRVPTHYPVPTHLVGLLQPDADRSSETTVLGSIRCACGSEALILSYVGDLVVNNEADELAEKFLRVTEQENFFFLKLIVKCPACSSENLLFDMHLHGWNGYVCGEEEDRSASPPSAQVWGCLKCGDLRHKIEFTVVGEDEETALQEGEDILTPEDWFNGFGWLDVVVTCVKCGDGPNKIVSFETM